MEFDPPLRPLDEVHAVLRPSLDLYSLVQRRNIARRLLSDPRVTDSEELSRRLAAKHPAARQDPHRFIRYIEKTVNNTEANACPFNIQYGKRKRAELQGDVVEPPPPKRRRIQPPLVSISSDDESEQQDFTERLRAEHLRAEMEALEEEFASADDHVPTAGAARIGELIALKQRWRPFFYELVKLRVVHDRLPSIGFPLEQLAFMEDSLGENLLDWLFEEELFHSGEREHEFVHNLCGVLGAEALYRSFFPFHPLFNYVQPTHPIPISEERVTSAGLLGLLPLEAREAKVHATMEEEKEEKKEPKEDTSTEKDETDKTTCDICFKSKIDCVIDLCGHAYFCYACIQGLKEKKCPLCRGMFIKAIRLYHKAY
jgi:hypothetical protein